MKKLLFAAALISSILLCACTYTLKKSVDNSVNDLIAKFVVEILEELSIKEGDNNWSYTYQEVYPEDSEGTAYIIDFYVFDHTSSHTKWYCMESEGFIDCDIMYATYF